MSLLEVDGSEALVVLGSALFQIPPARIVVEPSLEGGVPRLVAVLVCFAPFGELRTYDSDPFAQVRVVPLNPLAIEMWVHVRERRNEDAGAIVLGVRDPRTCVLELRDRDKELGLILEFLLYTGNFGLVLGIRFRFAATSRDDHSQHE